MKRNEELNAHSDLPLAPGLIVVIDLDKFGEYIETRGLDPYKPNMVTGELTRLIENFVVKQRGVVVYGLDKKRGTEEAVIEIPFADDRVEEVVFELERIVREIEKYGVSATAVVVRDYVVARPAKTRREAYKGTPGRLRALRALRSAKNKGGGKIVVLA